MWPDRESNPEPLTYESGALPTALHGPAGAKECRQANKRIQKAVKKAKEEKAVKKATED